MIKLFKSAYLYFYMSMGEQFESEPLTKLQRPNPADSVIAVAEIGSISNRRGRPVGGLFCYW